MFPPQTLGGGSVLAQDVASVSLEHVLCDIRGQPCDWVAAQATQASRRSAEGGSYEVTLESLGHLRLDPTCRGSNMVLDSTAIAARELAELAADVEEGRVALVCDVTTVDEGRDVDGLERVVRQVEKIDIAYGASIAAFSAATAAEAVAALRRQLEVGPRRAAFVTLRFDLEDEALLAGAAEASAATGALVVATLPAAQDAETLLRSARAAVDRFGPRVVLRSPARCDPALLAPLALAVVDGFGRPLERVQAPAYDLDDRERLGLLTARPDLHSGLVASVGLRYRTQLAAYGGQGYGRVESFFRDDRFAKQPAATTADSLPTSPASCATPLSSTSWPSTSRPPSWPFLSPP